MDKLAIGKRLVKLSGAFNKGAFREDLYAMGKALIHMSEEKFASLLSPELSKEKKSSFNTMLDNTGEKYFADSKMAASVMMRFFEMNKQDDAENIKAGPGRLITEEELLERAMPDSCESAGGQAL